jgi:hypothetical protein
MLDDHSGLGGCHSRILDRWTATQAAPKAPVDVAATDLEDLAAKLGA